MIFNLSDGGAKKLALSYTGTMTQSSITVDGAAYTLYTLTDSGTLTVKGKGTADLWCCGGGSGGGANAASYLRGYDGGAGAYCASLTALKLGGEYAVVIGAGGAALGAGGATSIVQGGETIFSASGASGKNGGTGGGSGVYTTDGDFNAVAVAGGTGDGVTKYPFADSANFECHCAGGGGGAAYATNNTANGYHTDGGAGGTNGGKVIWHSTAAGGSAATFYGSGGGGAGVRRPSDGEGGTVLYKGACGAGYQGIVYIRIPA